MFTGPDSGSDTHTHTNGLIKPTHTDCPSDRVESETLVSLEFFAFLDGNGARII
jgi:hypothetical protein